MKTILVYGDSNSWGAIPQPVRGAGGRFPMSVRWPGVLREALGGAAWVVEEGLNGRTTCVDDPIEGRRKNGERLLPALLETHAPLDLVVIMLGTNDLKARLSMQAGDIADGAGKLVDIVLASRAGLDDGVPGVLLIAPPPLARLDWLAGMFEGGSAKSLAFGAEFGRVAAVRGIDCLDAGSVVRSSDIDGIHLDASSHRALGAAVAKRAATLLDL